MVNLARIAAGILLGLPVVAVMATPATAGTQVLAFSPLSNVQTDRPVEQQTTWDTEAEHAACPGGETWWPCDDTYWPAAGVSVGSTWTVNNTGCAWDADDHSSFGGSGTLGAGTTVSKSECMVAEGTYIYTTKYDLTSWWSNTPKVNGFTVTAPAGTLDVSACYQPQNRCFNAAPIYDSTQRDYVYEGCVSVGYASDSAGSDPAIVAIPNSGKGGLGVLTALTFSVSNRTVHSLHGVSAELDQIPWGVSCTTVPGRYLADYPFTYSVAP